MVMAYRPSTSGIDVDQEDRTPHVTILCRGDAGGAAGLKGWWVRAERRLFVGVDRVTSATRGTLRSGAGPAWVLVVF